MKWVEIFVGMLSIMVKLVITNGLKNDIRRVLVADEIHAGWIAIFQIPIHPAWGLFYVLAV
ncbi:hypothetical protein C0W35_19675 [Photobacterium kishitanii]|nr:hypothetical protein C0W35_19675 [Photobacterium kishitanii]